MIPENLRFPIGQFEYNSDCTEEEIQNWITTIQSFPQKIEEITTNLQKEQLAWRYRPEGWSVKQVVHHCADSHMNSFIRFKLALTEDTPTIRPYEEQLWAEMIDEIDDNLSASIQILKGVHHRWVIILNHFTSADWNRQFIHPATQKVVMLKEALGLYAWHCEQHLAHIMQALEYQGKFGSL
ncbi:MAG: putative metal-dependent hydrolase [Limnohabitans sp.]|nr:putative metal-dependent hydrolase [Limnohabitans sp.]